MKIAVLYSGPFGEQIINTISLGGFASGITSVYELRPERIAEAHPESPDVLSRLWEDPDAYIPPDIGTGPADLLLVLGIHARLSDLVPPIARRFNVRAVLYAIDDRDTMPEARRTIREDLSASGITVEFVEPFCIL
ncbi:MAG: hypothetical protein LUQ25_08425, partial [Methanoregulaceae archaeon]|nr:hypothetical protein [Methanoregulaceae archaeon]